MKEYSKKFLLAIMSLLCVLVLFSCTSISSKAADTLPYGTLIDGINFNLAIKKLVKPSVSYPNEKDTLIKNIYFTNSPMSTRMAANVGNSVTAYFNSSKGDLYIYCYKQIRFNPDSKCMFRNLINLQSINFGNSIDTRSVQELNCMFQNDIKLKSIDLSSLKTENCTNMYGMFSGCSGLESLNLTSFNTAKCANISTMFYGCSSLKSVNLSSFNTANVKDMSRLFVDCKALTSVDLKNFNTSNVTDMQEMFSGCSSLKQVNLSGFNTANVTNLSYMFNECSSLETVDLRSFKLTEINYDAQGAGFFNYCDSLKTIYAPSYIPKDFAYDYITDIDIGNQQFVRKLGQIAVDDNNNGIPDHGTFYSKFPKSDVPHKYLVVSKLANPAKVDGEDPQVVASREAHRQKTYTVNGITYTIDNDSNATAIKFGDIKKASINKVTINGVTYPVVAISDGACMNNKVIKKLTLGANVKTIGKNAFKGCKKLKKITIKANKKLKVGKNAFKKLPKKATITVKSVKGNVKTKVMKALKKQTNAKVK